MAKNDHSHDDDDDHDDDHDHPGDMSGETEPSALKKCLSDLFALHPNVIQMFQN